MKSLKEWMFIILIALAITITACSPSSEEVAAIAEAAAQKAVENIPTPTPVDIEAVAEAAAEKAAADTAEKILAGMEESKALAEATVINGTVVSETLEITPGSNPELVVPGPATPITETNVIEHNAADGVPAWSITNVPELVDLTGYNISEDHPFSEMQNRPLEGPVAWTTINSAGLWTGDPGVYNTHNEQDSLNNPSARLITPLSQHLFTLPLETVPVQEGAFTWVNACGMEVQVLQDQEGVGIVLTTIKLECAEGHAWFLIVRGLGRDYATPWDKNISLVVALNEAFGHAQMFAPGSKLSYIYTNDNVNAAFEENSCGSDGCYPNGVSILFYDPETGAFTVSHKAVQDGGYNTVATNTGDTGHNDPNK